MSAISVGLVRPAQTSERCKVPKLVPAEAARKINPAVPSVDPDHLKPALQEVVSILADIEAQYARDRDALDHWTGPELVKRRLCEDLDQWRRRTREPYAQRLAELHMQALSLTMFRTKH